MAGLATSSMMSVQTATRHAKRDKHVFMLIFLGHKTKSIKLSPSLESNANSEFHPR